MARIASDAEAFDFGRQVIVDRLTSAYFPRCFVAAVGDYNPFLNKLLFENPELNFQCQYMY